MTEVIAGPISTQCFTSRFLIADGVIMTSSNNLCFLSLFASYTIIESRVNIFNSLTLFGLDLLGCLGPGRVRRKVPAAYNSFIDGIAMKFGGVVESPKLITLV